MNDTPIAVMSGASRAPCAAAGTRALDGESSSGAGGSASRTSEERDERASAGLLAG